jgi:hypothetical protein
MRKILALASLGLLAATASAQCATYSVSGSGSSGGSLTFSFNGSASGAYVFAVIGQTEGSLPINLGMLGSLTLGITDPTAVLPIGIANAQGDASLTLNIPANAPSTGVVNLKSQGVSLGVSGLPTGGPGGGPGGGGMPNLGFSWCTSNVVSFTLGS